MWIHHISFLLFEKTQVYGSVSQQLAGFNIYFSLNKMCMSGGKILISRIKLLLGDIRKIGTQASDTCVIWN
jgi:hypothetical protein